MRVVIPDTRFLDEAEAVLEQDGKLIKVVRPGYGPGPNRPDRELLGFQRWTNIIGETGDIRQLELWTARYAAWLCGAEKAERTTEEIKTAKAVRKSAYESST